MTSKRVATAKANRDFIDIATMSGHRLLIVDPLRQHHHLEANVDDRELGTAIISALNGSRALSPDEGRQLRADANNRYESWVADILQRYDYRDRKQMFRDMLSCRIEGAGSAITFIPLRHEKLEGWSGDGFSPDDNVVVDASSEPEKLGAALRLALARCK